MRRASAIVCLCLGALISCVDGVYAAQSDIGSAALAKNDVSRELSGANAPVGVGDPVFPNEIVRTGEDSATKLVFRDWTNLALGPKPESCLTVSSLTLRNLQRVWASRLQRACSASPPAVSRRAPIP